VLSTRLRWHWKLWKSSVLAVTRGRGYLSGNLKATAELLVNASWRQQGALGGIDSAPGPLAHRLCLVCDDANMRGVRCTDPDGETIIYRSARSVAEWIETVTGKAVSDYHVKTTASRNGELNGFQLSHATDEEQQQLLRGGVTQPDKEVSAAGAIPDGAIGLSNSVDR